ncbi:hypothetical protein BCV70DRAFT_197788 [Testicularia cyperi]|uniref:Glutaredoxin domain-containing protein n=1 Tax=Testicularia cyperi TaxID=1882483 RepID=A0A317XZ64_9BASI|nr:hypothetical protein BCV70DRAFT_197788 [Testicularia cyperi]
MSAIREKKQLDLEAGLSAGAGSSAGATSGCLPPLALFRRRKALLFCITAPLLFIVLVYQGTLPSPFALSMSRNVEKMDFPTQNLAPPVMPLQTYTHTQTRTRAAAATTTATATATATSPTTTTAAVTHTQTQTQAQAQAQTTSTQAAQKQQQPALEAPVAEINALAGQLPGGVVGAASSSDGNTVDAEGHVHNALLDKLHLEGTEELHKLETELTAPGKKTTSAANSKLQAQDMIQFDARSESILLLLQALKSPDYAVGKDWRDVFVERKGLPGGLFGTLNSGATNKFTQLLSKVGLGPNPENGDKAVAAGVKAEDAKAGPVGQGGVHVKDDPLQLYRLVRSEWVEKMRQLQGLTVFSKSYCPYSKKAKALLTSFNATFTVYEVDLRPDAEYLQPLLAKLTDHQTYPTILVQDRLLGGSDDLADLDKLGALKSVLESVHAV